MSFARAAKPSVADMKPPFMANRKLFLQYKDELPIFVLLECKLIAFFLLNGLCDISCPKSRYMLSIYFRETNALFQCSEHECLSDLRLFWFIVTGHFGQLSTKIGNSLTATRSCLSLICFVVKQREHRSAFWVTISFFRCTFIKSAPESPTGHMPHCQ